MLSSWKRVGSPKYASSRSGCWRDPRRVRGLAGVRCDGRRGVEFFRPYRRPARQDRRRTRRDEAIAGDGWNRVSPSGTRGARCPPLFENAQFLGDGERDAPRRAKTRLVEAGNARRAYIGSICVSAYQSPASFCLKRPATSSTLNVPRNDSERRASPTGRGAANFSATKSSLPGITSATSVSRPGEPISARVSSNSSCVELIHTMSVASATRTRMST